MKYMGASKDGGYTQKSVVTPDQQTFLNQQLQQAGNNQQQAATAYNQFLPQSADGQVGGQGGQSFIDQALQSYREKFLPEAFNSLGAGANSKGSSALNNAIAQGASQTQTDLSTILSGLQQQSASGLAGLGSQQGQAVNKDQFALTPKQQPLWQSALLGLLGAGGQIGGAYAGRPTTNFNTGR